MHTYYESPFILCIQKYNGKYYILVFMQSTSCWEGKEWPGYEKRLLGWVVSTVSDDRERGWDIPVEGGSKCRDGLAPHHLLLGGLSGSLLQGPASSPCHAVREGGCQPVSPGVSRSTRPIERGRARLPRRGLRGRMGRRPGLRKCRWSTYARSAGPGGGRCPESGAQILRGTVRP